MNIFKKGDWVIFYVKNNIRYYFVKMYKIGRLRFSKKKYASFDSSITVTDALTKIEPYFKLYFPNEKLMCGYVELKK